MKDTKTTVSGILMIVGALLSVISRVVAGHFDPGTDGPLIISGIAGGIGLITAKDSEKHP